MLALSDTLPPAPTNSDPGRRVLPVGGVNFLVNGRHGGFLANHQDLYLGHALIKYGEYGEIEWNLLQQLARPGAIVAEVGANIGTHTIPFAKLVGPTGRVIAVEPQRVIHQYLCANVSLNSLANVETYHAGCGAHTGQMAVPIIDYFARTTSNFGGLSLVEKGKGEPVPIRMLDDIVGERAVMLIKIDVEGMEADVIRGAKRTIKRCRPFLYVENDRVEKSEELIKLLMHYQYRLYWHLPKLYNPQNFFEEPENIYGEVVSCNMFCLPKEITMDMRHFHEVLDPMQHPLKPLR